MTFITSRFTIAALVMLPFAFKRFRTATATHWKEATILSAIYFISFAAQTVGLKYTSAVKSAFITGLFVVFTPLFQTILQRRPPGRANIVAILLAVTGVIFLSSTGTSLFEVIYLIGSDFTAGDALTLLCAIMYAVYIVYLDMTSKDMDYIFLSYMQIAFTAVCSGIFLFVLAGTGIEIPKFTMNYEVLRAIGYTALLATIITTTLQTKFQKFVTPTRASIIFSMEPIFASVFAFIILQERFTMFGVFGAVCIISGLLVSELFSKE